MHKLALIAVSAFTLFPASAQKAAPYFTEPSVSPNRAEVAFVSGGDIWIAPLAGGEAHLLVSHPANETRPMYSPDGTRLAFVSNRTGNGDIYVLHLATGALKRITFDDAAEQLDAWSRDGKYLYFSSTAQDVGGMNDIYRVSAEGGTPVAVTADRYVTEFFSAPSPDGKSLAFTARGNTSGQWWRHGHSHLDESEIWLATSPAAEVRELAGGDFKCLWPMWSADGARVYYMSDQGGAENLWEKPVRGGAAKQVTQFHDGRLLWPSISYDGKTIVFERDFGIWKLDVASGKAAPIEITRRGAPGTPEVTHLSLNNQFRDLVLSPDGKQGRLRRPRRGLRGGARDGGSGDARHPHSGQREPDRLVAGQPPRRLRFRSRRRLSSLRLRFLDQRRNAPHQRLRRRDRARLERRRQTAGVRPRRANSSASTTRHRSRCACWPPDAFRARRSAPTASTPGRPTASGSPISTSARAASAMSTWSRRRAASRSRSASSPTPTAARVLWAPDGTYILFDTNQRTENNNIARIDLLLRTPPFREDRFRELFRDAPPRAALRAARQRTSRPPSPYEIVFDGIRNRLSMLQTGLDARMHQISPDGKTLLLSASTARQQNFYTWSLDETGDRTAGGAPGDFDRRREDRRPVLARRQGDLLPGAGPHHHRHARHARFAPACRDRGDGRRFRAGKNRSLRPGLDLPERQFLRPQIQRRRLEGRARALRAACRRRAHAGRTAPRALADARRAERLAHGHRRAGGRRRWAAARHGRQTRPPLRRRRVRRARASCASPKSSRSGPAAIAGDPGRRRPGGGGRRGDRPPARTSTSCWNTRSTRASC